MRNTTVEALLEAPSLRAVEPPHKAETGRAVVHSRKRRRAATVRAPDPGQPLQVPRALRRLGRRGRRGRPCVRHPRRNRAGRCRDDPDPTHAVQDALVSPLGPVRPCRSPRHVSVSTRHRHGGATEGGQTEASEAHLALTGRAHRRPVRWPQRLSSKRTNQAH